MKAARPLFAFLALAATLMAQQPPARPATEDHAQTPITLETSETLFAVTAALNSCGFDMDLQPADAVRNRVRAQIAERLKSSMDALTAREQLCRYYRDKQLPDPSQNLSQYLSLAIYLSAPPEFATTVKEADLPADASNVLGFVPLLQRFYDLAGLNSIWKKQQRDYEMLIPRMQAPVAQMILKTDLYLKLPMSGYLGRKYVVYVEPMGAGSQVNARNYANDYFLVVTPSANSLKMDMLRHTYLHFALDPLVMKRAHSLKRLDPLLDLVKNAPINEDFKNDAALMVTESLIRAIEARLVPLAGTVKDKERDADRMQSVQASMEEGFILTQYFYEQLADFEKEPTSMRDALGDMLFRVSLGDERKRAQQIVFRSQASPEVVRASNPRKPQMLDLAEEKLSQGDPQGAHRLAQQVLDQKTEDPARAMFILGKAAALNKDVDGAQLLFERTLEIAREPRTVAWSHILLARILDLKCNRQSALTHYKAALQAGDPTPDTRSAAERGVKDAPVRCKEFEHQP